MTFTLANIKAAGSRVTEYHAPFKAEGTDIRNAFGVIVGAGIDEVHANAFAAAGNMRPALEAAEYWIEEQAWSPIAENGEILRTIRDALGKPHDATDAAPSAPQTPAPDWREIAGSLVGLAAARAEEMESAVGEGGDAWSQEEADGAWSAVEAARAAFAGNPIPQTPKLDLVTVMLEALRVAEERIEVNNYGDEEEPFLVEVRAAIKMAEDANNGR